VFCSRKPNTNDKAHFVLFDIFSAGTDETPVFSSPDRSSASGFCCLLFKMTWQVVVRRFFPAVVEAGLVPSPV